MNQYEIAKIEGQIECYEADVRSIRDYIKSQNRGPTDQEKRALYTFETKIEELKHQIRPKSLTFQLAGGSMHGSRGGGERGELHPSIGKGYCSMFGLNRQGLDKGGFENFNEFLTILSTGRFDSRLIQNQMSETAPSSGGFLVPEEFAAWLLDASLEDEVIRPGATVWPMKSDTLKVPGWDASTHSDSLFGGLVGTWLAELQAATEVSAKFRQIQLTAKKLACYTSASNELVQDGIDFESQIQTALVKTLSWYLDYSFIQGSGAGMPLGILSDPALITVEKESGQGETVIYENCVKMYARLAPQCMKTAIWIASQTCIPQLLTMSLAVGTGGSIIQPAVMQSNGQFSLLGKPMLFTEKCPALGSLGQLILVDRSQYTIGMRREVSLDRSIHVGWTQDTSSYRAIVRIDGQGTWDKAITPKHGDSLSWCVALEA